MSRWEELNFKMCGCVKNRELLIKIIDVPTEKGILMEKTIAGFE